MLTLYEYGELNQSKLISYCGLNNAKHRKIIDDLVVKGLISGNEEPWGKKMNIQLSLRGRAIQPNPRSL